MSVQGAAGVDQVKLVPPREGRASAVPCAHERVKGVGDEVGSYEIEQYHVDDGIF